MQDERVNLRVPFEEKDQAKKLGARWDVQLKVWYVPKGISLEPFAKWLEMPHEGGRIEIFPPFYSLHTGLTCWSCRQTTIVHCLATTTFQELDWDGPLEESLYPLFFLSRLPQSLEKQYLEEAIGTRLTYSKTAKGRYLMNHCSSCDAPLGDNFLFSEPSDPFHPIDENDASLIVIQPLDYSDSATICGSFLIGVGDLILECAEQPGNIL